MAHYIGFNAFQEAACPNIQKQLNDILAGASPERNRTKTGYLDSLVSDLNTSGYQQVQNTDSMNRRIVEVHYVQRPAIDLVLDTQIEDFCSSPNRPEPLKQDVEIKYTKQLSFTVTKSDFQHYCATGYENFVRQRIIPNINTLSNAVNLHLLAIQAASFGLFADGSAFKLWDPLLAGSPNYTGLNGTAANLEQFMLATGADMPIIVGAGELFQYVKAANIGCCNSTLGIDISQVVDFAYFYDAAVTPTVGGPTESYIWYQPGSVQFLQYQKYLGEQANNTDTQQSGVIMDPITGIFFDYDQTFTECNKKVTIFLSIDYDLFTLPLNTYAATDELFGVNGTFLFNHS